MGVRTIISQDTVNTNSTDSTATITTGSLSEQHWYENDHAKNTLISSSSAFYALILTIVALIYELIHLMEMTSEHEPQLVRWQDLYVGFYMYGLGILFLSFCYYELYNRHKHKSMGARVQTMMRLRSMSDEVEKHDESETHSIVEGLNEEEVPFHLEILTAGSWFLRLGCMVFGMIGISYYIFGIYFCYRDTKCDASATVSLNLLSIIFLTTQGHFIFRNWKISKTKSILIAKFGTMHLVGANLWTWIRFFMVEQAVMYKKVCLSFDKTTSSSYVNLSDSHEIIGKEEACKGGMGSFIEGLTGLMYTSLVEYSLIGAAVMYIVWRNVKQKDEKKLHPEHKETPIHINLKHTFYGAIFGVIFVLSCIIPMVLYNVYYDDEREYVSQYIFSVTNCIQYIIFGTTCLIALYQMRVLVYIDIPENEQEEEEESQERLDMILLIVGMIGEMIYSGTGLAGLIQPPIKWNGLIIFMLIAHISRIVQVHLQSILIYIARKLHIGNRAQIWDQPGKQAITFLLIANVSMFIINLFEAKQFGVNENVVVHFGEKQWVYLVRSFSPLTIFYRFHSSVCFAEIWRNTYAKQIEKIV